MWLSSIFESQCDRGTITFNYHWFSHTNCFAKVNLSQIFSFTSKEQVFFRRTRLKKSTICSTVTSLRKNSKDTVRRWCADGLRDAIWIHSDFPYDVTLTLTWPIDVCTRRTILTSRINIMLQVSPCCTHSGKKKSEYSESSHHRGAVGRWASSLAAPWRLEAEGADRSLTSDIWHRDHHPPHSNLPPAVDRTGLDPRTITIFRTVQDADDLQSRRRSH